MIVLTTMQSMELFTNVKYSVVLESLCGGQKTCQTYLGCVELPGVLLVHSCIVAMCVSLFFTPCCFISFEGYCDI